MNTRITTGLLGGVALLTIIFLLPVSVFYALCIVAACVAWFEWLNMHKNLKSGDLFADHLNFDTLEGDGQWFKGALILMGIAYLCAGLLFRQVSWLYPLLQIMLLGTALGLLTLIRHRHPDRGSSHFYLPNLAHWVGGLFYISFIFVYILLAVDLGAQNALSSQTGSHLALGASHHAWIIFKLLLLVWGGDSAGYLVGSLWGRKKLSLYLSPNKTIQGLVGTLLWTTCVFPIAFWGQTSPGVLITLGLLTGLLSTFGDLFASAIKRGYGIKDFGAVLPGHGGIIDRVDSFLFVSPFYFMLIHFHVIMG